MAVSPHPSLDPFFNPTGILLVGVSQNPTKLGYGLARNLVESDFRGSIHFVGPRGGTLFDRPIHQQISDVPDPVQLAVLLIPAEIVPETLEVCGQRGIQAAIIAAGGFREIGAEGAALEARCLQIARQYNMRLMGPNCIGLLDTHLPLNTTFLPPPGPPAGDIAFISHSGAICAAVIDWSWGQGFGLSRLISLGNQLDMQESDVLASVAADPYTKVITMYLEGVGNGRNFLEAAAQVTPHKPILALKVGRFASGQQAAASHTGALAGQESAFDAAFARAGVLRAETSEQMFDWARALAWSPLPNGKRVAILTNAGGPGVTAADAVEANGLSLGHLGVETTNSLRENLPLSASVHNPVDMLANASPEQYATCLELLLADEGVDSVLVILPPPPMFTAGGVARAIIPVIERAQKPVVVAVMGERLIQEAVEYFRAARVPEYRFPEKAAAALAVLAKRAEFLRKPRLESVAVTNVDRETAVSLITSLPTGPIPQEILTRILTAYGIPIPIGHLAKTTGEAAAIAKEMGFPVVLKIAAAEISHKSDVGGIALGLGDETAVSNAFTTMTQQIKRQQPDAKIEGVYVQQMAAPGQEVIVGVTRDPQFGPLLMFGSGGVEVEGLEDVAFALAPVLPEEADELLNKTWAGRKLAGFRHLVAADETAVRDVIFRLGQLAADFPQISEIEINPLRVFPAGNGVLALDVRAQINKLSI